MTVAHQLRTSLTVVRGHLELLSRLGVDAPEIGIALAALDEVENTSEWLLRQIAEERPPLLEDRQSSRGASQGPSEPLATPRLNWA